jgi:hypothetical protein
VIVRAAHANAAHHDAAHHDAAHHDAVRMPTGRARAMPVATSPARGPSAAHLTAAHPPPTREAVGS